MNALQTYLVDPIVKHYVDFKGRATRKQFWLFTLFLILIMFILGIILGIAGVAQAAAGNISMIIQIALFLPSLAIAIRRLRDAGFSPWWILIGLIPLLGWFVLFVFYCFPSKK